jgi:hypothetical protein
MGGRLIVEPGRVIRHTPKSRRLPDKLQELMMRCPEDARNLEKLVDFALRRLDGELPTVPFRRPVQ